jgi:hypothetical protein
MLSLLLVVIGLVGLWIGWSWQIWATFLIIGFFFAAVSSD